MSTLPLVLHLEYSARHAHEGCQARLSGEHNEGSGGIGTRAAHVEVSDSGVGAAATGGRSAPSWGIRG